MKCENGIVHNNAQCNLACGETLQGGQCTCGSAGCVSVSSCDKSECDIAHCNTFFPNKKITTFRCDESHHRHGSNTPAANDKQPPTCESIGVKNDNGCKAQCRIGTSVYSCSGSNCMCKCNSKVVCSKPSAGSGAGVWVVLIFLVAIGSTIGYVWWKKKNGEPLPEFFEKLPFIGRNNKSGFSGDLSYQKI